MAICTRLLASSLLSDPNGFRADWRLADGTLVEAAGMMTDPTYVAKMNRKQQLARKAGLRVITVTEVDLPRLATLLAYHLPPGRRKS